ncbi:hypothetical protein VNO77_44419 [Canavalia gladiata]|uniref:Uncharacterized protein n=1 Tax=Canavalia gladiata TaxID=3824 RepID=A0AAN9JY21_CANGL
MSTVGPADLHSTVAKQGVRPAEVPSGAGEQGVGPADVPSGAGEQGVGPADVPSGAGEQGVGSADVPSGAGDQGVGPPDVAVRKGIGLRESWGKCRCCRRGYEAKRWGENGEKRWLLGFGEEQREGEAWVKGLAFTGNECERCCSSGRRGLKMMADEEGWNRMKEEQPPSTAAVLTER